MSRDRIIADLEASLLTPEDIQVRELDRPELAATRIPFGVQGYVIPYRDLEGQPLPFYRVRTFDYDPKYKQSRATSNCVYFPKNVKQLILEKGYVIITEGEKKAACATKCGYPAVGLSGVDSWKNRTVVLPEGTALEQQPNTDRLVAKLPAGEQSIEDSDLATGLQELIDLCVSKRLTTIICFDSDHYGTTKHDVQRAAASLGFELRFKGLPLTSIRQLVLPHNLPEKVGIDDFIVRYKAEAFGEQIQACMSRRVAFPRHPNIRDFVNRKLQKQKLSRKEAQQVALSVLCELDSSGVRLRSETDDNMYYFSGSSRKLMGASLRRTVNDVLVDSEFGRYLYAEFGIGYADMRLSSWLATQFTSEDPIDTVRPNRVIAVRDNEIAYQINDGQYVRVTGDPDRPFTILDNGTDGIMFESGKVKPLVATELSSELKAQMACTLKPVWFDVLRRVRLKKASTDKTLQLVGLLYYLSPWLNRWRGTQLPVEMVIGEAGSGKSSLYELRLNILQGDPKLRNRPQDMKDWWAGLKDAGGLHVTDNVHMTDKNLKQSLSDEMCRMVTEPNPHVEMRKYYTEFGLTGFSVNTVFAMTAIQQPFHNVDLIQRSIILEFDKGDEAIEYATNWADQQLTSFGGRTSWVAHHLVVLHKFLQTVNKHWDITYKSKHRLVNLEQILMLMARTFNLPSDWIVQHLSSATVSAVSESDWALEGIIEFCRQARAGMNGAGPPTFGASEISAWALGEEDYNQCLQLTNIRSLGRYIQTHKQMIAVTTGLVEATSANNVRQYTLRPMRT